MSDAPDNRPSAPAPEPDAVRPGDGASGNRMDGATPGAEEERRRRGFSRRGFFGTAAGSLVAGGAIGAGVVAAAKPGRDPLPASTISRADSSSALSYPFYGQAHQPGIQTPPQLYMVFSSFEVTASTPAELQVLLATWSAAISRLMAGHTVGQATPVSPNAVPVDSGEALDLGPSGLTVTLGLGPGIFGKRFGLEKFKPAKLADLPALPSDQLQASLSGGDICIQACADDPQVAYHAVRNLTSLGAGSVVTKWTVMGFGRASAGPNQETPRNLMGFKDGTRNIQSAADYKEFVWIGDEDTDQSWMRGGSYLVARKIHMSLENWDLDVIGDQQTVFGRHKGSGAPLGGKTEKETPDFAAKDASGDEVISPTAHIALAAHENNGGTKILRRSYNYTDGVNQYGQTDAGLMFVAFMKDPEQFITLQRKLGASDRLNEYIQHIGSGLFAVPPAPKRAGDYYGKTFFEV